MSEQEILTIDGSFGEGGGSIVRLGAGFSSLYGAPIELRNIRANRSKPGLRTQHLLGLHTLSKLTGSKLSECKVGTEQLTFHPREKISDKIEVKINTAASLGLLLQPLQIASLGFKEPSQITIRLRGGGTFGKWAPSLNYLKNTTYKIFEQAGLNIELEIKKQGFYPKGGANVVCTLYPPQKELKPIHLTKLGTIKAIKGEIILTEHLKGKNIPQRIEKSLTDHLRQQIEISPQITSKYVNSLSAGVGFSVWGESDTGAIISTGTIIGERHIASEKLGENAAKILTKYLRNDIPVDNYLSDQLIPLMAYNKQSSEIKVLEVTSHAQTNLDLIKKFTGRDYKITKEKNHSLIQYKEHSPR